MIYSPHYGELAFCITDVWSVYASFEKVIQIIGTYFPCLLRVRQIYHRIAASRFAFAAAVLPLAAYAEKANVFFIHDTNVSEQDARAGCAVP